MNQQYQFADVRLKDKILRLDMGGFFTDPALFLDDEQLSVSAGNCYVMSDTGEALRVHFRKKFMDRYPSVILGGKEHHFVKPLTVTQKIALVLPFLFVITNGLLGWIAAFVLWILNGRLFRRDISSGAKIVLYVVSFITTLFILLVLLPLLSLLIGMRF